MLSTADTVAWTDRVRTALSGYAEPRLRDVATRLVKPRTPIPDDELVDRCISVLMNPPVVDRRIRDLPEASHKLLILVGLSRRPTWKVGHLVTLLAALGHVEGYTPILSALESGLLFPDRTDGEAELSEFEAWLGGAGSHHATVFAHPAVATRARGEDLGLPTLVGESHDNVPRVADGLDWMLRLAVVWQEVDDAAVRLTQSHLLFKRDLTRLQSDEVLTATGSDQLVELPDVGILALYWANAAGLLASVGGELRANPFPPTWGTSTATTLADLWAGLTDIEPWDPLRGYAPTDSGLSPTPTAGFLTLLLLGKLSPATWADPQTLADWLWEHHPSWSGTLPLEEANTRGRAWVAAFLLGVAFPLKLVDVTDVDGWKVRLSELGRHLLADGPEPPPSPLFPQTLLVQPNADVLAYRQGMTPSLIGRLSRFARWKGVGPACTLELNPTRTYHGLESGLTLASILQTLNQHGMKPVPPSVADLLRRWADKRERIALFSSATLVEFQTPADLETAIARGVVSIRVTDRIGLTDDGRDPDFKHLRLVGNRDYEAKPQRCLTADGDGVTLTVDPAQSDLLLEAEIGRVADPVTGDPPGVRRFRITPATLRRALDGGVTLEDLDGWFIARSGDPLPPAGRLFVIGPALPPPTTARYLVVHLPSEVVADGLVQWPETRQFVDRRLGPTAVVVDEANLPRLVEMLSGLGIVLS